MFLDALLEKAMGMLKVEALDDETIRMIERMVFLRVATKKSICGNANWK